MWRLLPILLVNLVLSEDKIKTTDEDLADLPYFNLCLKGSFSYDGYGEHSSEYPCELCAPGEFGDVEGLDECSPCSEGSYTPDMGYWECLQCPKGHIADAEWSEECYPCYSGQYSPVLGGTSCENCPIGRYQDEEGAGECKACPVGEYQDTPASDSCKQCSAGTSSLEASTSSASCTECPSGSYSPVAGSMCLLCPIETYNDVSGAVSCKECLSNVDMEGAKECIVTVTCPNGKIDVEGVCTACPKGQYAAAGAEICVSCVAGFYNDIEGASVCKECPAQTYSPSEGLADCLDCPSNAAAGMTECPVECPAGEVESETGECVPCIPGTYEIKGKCELCPVGQFSGESGSVVCEDCAAGSYNSDPGQVSCTTCEAGTISTEAGQTSCIDCSAGSYSATSTECEQCSPGQFSAVKAAECSLCPEGTFNDETGSAECSQCSAGQFSDQAGSVVCEDCAAGSYNSDPGQVSCTACEAGTISTEAGQTSCTDCSAGSYSATSTECEQCSPGQFSAVKAAECSLCPEGSFNDETGSAECSQCSAGQFSDQAGSVVCEDCAAGSYNSDPGQVSCTTCEAGTISTEAGQTSCIDCSAGSYSATSTECEQCSPGQFSAVKAAECSLCPEGTFNSETGSAECSEAPAGTYIDGEGSVAPTPCPKNTYRSEVGGTAVSDCSHCPADTETSVTGSTSVEACTVVHCNPGYYKDPVNGCVICQPGTFSKTENSGVCTPCPKNSYNSIGGSIDCLKCPDTAYTWDVASDSFDKCIGPLIEVCSDVDMKGACYKYFDDNLQLSMAIKSLNVLRGEFELYEGVNHAGAYISISESDGSINVDESSTIKRVLSFKAEINNVFCSLDKGVDYRGSVRDTSRSGKACINWSNTPLAELAKPNNYCQNPDENNLAEKPFCFISETESEECDVPECIWDMDCYTGVGAQYRGHKGKSEHSKTCQNWENIDFPRPGSKYKEGYNWAGIGDHSFCRNPDDEGTGKPWCYTTSANPWYRWDYCTIPRCYRDEFYFYRF